MVISDDNAICLKSEKNEHGTSWKFSYIQLVPESVPTGCQWKRSVCCTISSLGETVFCQHPSNCPVYAAGSGTAQLPFIC